LSEIDPALELLALTSALRGHVEWQRATGVVELPRAPVSNVPVDAPPPAADGRQRPRPAPSRAPAPESAPVVLPPSKPATERLDPSERAARLSVIQSEVAACTTCRLHETRTQTVFARGNGSVGLCFVGEGPGADEDAQGFPFVGKAGQLLDRMIEAMGFARDDVYVANIVKCLKYTTLVLLENGDWERVGRLVRSRYGGRVMSVDSGGNLVPKRVIGWHDSPLAGRRVYKLTYKTSRLRGQCKATTYLTEDHPILTRTGWVEARNLRDGIEIAIGQGLSRVAHDTVVGSLLGDGGISKLNAHLNIVHCRDQKEYATLKANALAELQPVVYDSVVSNQTRRQYLVTVCRTRASRALRTLRSRWYPEGKKRVPSDLTLTPLSLAVWFLDDGYTKVKSDACAMAEIAAHSFTPSELQHLEHVLARDFGLKAYQRASSPGRLYFGVAATRRLSEVIAPYCPPSMRYKLMPEVESKVPFERSLLEAGAQITLFDAAEIQEVEHTGSDQTFFCIDVEDTHNFVTSGGVVHNCRPPNNRKPEADEMAACVGYLERQLDIIQPEVIVALGATAVSGLLGTTEGITRLRGKWKLYKGRIAVMPTFHPAYLLRVPTAKRDVWNDLQTVLRQMGRPVPPPKK
jgi:uracil-DNA glycosylase